MASVGEAGEVVGTSLEAARVELASITKREPGADDAEHQGGRRQQNRGGRDRSEVVEDEEPGRGEREQQRHREHGPALEARATPVGRLPRGEADQAKAGRPAEIGQALVGEVAARDLIQVADVGGGERREAGAEQQPLAPGAPPAEGEGADHQADQQDVSERVGEIRGHGRRTRALEARGDHPVDQCDPDRGDDEAREQPVQPHAHREAPHAPAQQQPHGHVATGIDREPQRIRDRWERWRLQLLEPERPDHGAGHVHSERHRQHRPGRALSLHEQGAGAAETTHRRPGCDLHRVADLGPGGVPKAGEHVCRLHRDAEQHGRRAAEHSKAPRPRHFAGQEHRGWGHTPSIGAGTGT